MQTLLNDWRAGNESNINRLVEYEEKVTSLLMSEKVLPPLVKSKGVNNLSVKLLSEKVSNKLNDSLTKDQMQILSLAVKGDMEKLVPVLESTKKAALNSMRELRMSANNQTIREKIEPVERVLTSMDAKDISEQNVSKFLVITKLIEEVREGNDER